jgi:hypothetical protein
LEQGEKLVFFERLLETLSIENTGTKNMNARNFFSTTAVGLLMTLPSMQAQAAEPKVFDDVIAPILAAKCTACHGEEKEKGKLRLDSFEAIMKGGSDGDSVVPGNLEDSLMVFRIDLPADDDDVMPPEDEELLTAGEKKLIKWWIEKGAKKDITVAAAKVPGDLKGTVDSILKGGPAMKPAAAKEEEAVVLTDAEKKAIDAAVVKVSGMGASLMPIAADTPQLRFSALNVAKEYSDGNIALLKPVAAQIWWVDLAGTKVTDKGLAEVGAMKNLKRLYLQNTAVTDAGLGQLKGLSGLEYLNLYGTKVTNAGLQKLAGLGNLKKVFVWQTKVTKPGADAFRKKVPGAEVNVGWTEAEVAAVVASAEKTVAAEQSKEAAAKKPAAKAPAKPAPKPAAKPTAPVDPVAKAVAEANRIAAKAKAAAAAATKAAGDAEKAAAALTAKAAKAAKAVPKAAPKPQAKPAEEKKPVAKKAAPKPKKK